MSKIFRPMRSIAPETDHPIRYSKLASPKIDGIRSCLHQSKAVTKSVLPVPNKHIRAWLEANVPDGFDGELVSGDPRLETCYGLTFSAVMTQKGEPDFSFYVFDLCNRPDLKARERKALLKLMCEGLDARIIFVEQVEVFSDEEAKDCYERWLNMGYEGMMLVDPEGYYKFGKATAKQQEQLKVKPHEDTEGLILGTFEAMHNDNEAYINEVGETKRSTHAENKTPAGRVGGYIVEDVETKAVFKVGSGKMKHLMAKEEWEAYVTNPEHRKGTYLKFRRMDYGTMTNGAARHGRWIGWRDVTDMNPEDIGASV